MGEEKKIKPTLLIMMRDAMKDLVDFMVCCKQAYISGDGKRSKLKTCIISTDIKPNRTGQLYPVASNYIMFL